MREYNVILKKDVDYDSFWNDIESDTDNGKLYIPNRKVEFTNERPASLRQCWYLLTDEEAETLKQDDRVLAVEIPPEHRDDIKIKLRAIQTGDYTKTTSDSGAYINWGLIRSNFINNVYGSSTTTTESYNYTLTGEGVDVVIQDSGIQVDHPEFEDPDGNSRVQQINWATESGLAFTQNANHYRDYDGHGTHCAGIAAGKTYGWAKRARIYSQKISGLEGTGDSGTGISTTYAFDSIKIWHNNKPIQPKTGVKRPTVVNMSWGYYNIFGTITSINYRGTTYTGASIDTTAEKESFGLVLAAFSESNYRVASVDTDIQEMVDAGIIICVAAGNNSHKIDVSGGVDYNNYYNDGETVYYHRGSSPYDDEIISVGNMDSTSYSSTLDQKSTSSETGPGVTIYAPGTNIMSCTSTTNKWGSGSQNYYLNSAYRQTNISGTSMASPQVAGVCALILEQNPKLTPAQVKSALLGMAGDAIYDTGTNNDWSNNRSLKGGSKKVLFNKANSPQTMSVTNLTFSGVGIKMR
jgi:subtilisin family serine protease